MSDPDFRMNPDPPDMQPSDIAAPEGFTTPDRTERNHPVFTAPDQSVLAGVWECAPCRSEIDGYPVHEMMTVISGSVTLTHDGGRAETFTAGDTFFIPKGARCVWEITETLRKFYMIAT